MVTVLGFDCAGRGCGAAVLIDGVVAARRSEPMERGQAAALLPLIAAVLADAGRSASGLDLVAVTVGPGGFTGLRIGIAAARGLALAAGIPAIGVTSFAAQAAAVPAALRAGRSLAVALDSKRAEVFLQNFAADGEACGEAALVTPDTAGAMLPPGPLILAGDGAARLLPALGPRACLAPESDIPDPAAVARLGLAAWRAGERRPPRPLYLRAPDTSLPRAGR